MDYISKIENYKPANLQEIQDKKVILDYINMFPHNILLRDNEFAHLTSSGFIMNSSLDRVLMVHHNIMDSWAWTGGHMDGDTDLAGVAVKEAIEETGITNVHHQSGDIASLDILTVDGHMKRGKYVSSHLHLSVSYILIADENDSLTVKEDENSDVRWFSLDEFSSGYFSAMDQALYKKLIEKARSVLKMP